MSVGKWRVRWVEIDVIYSSSVRPSVHPWATGRVRLVEISVRYSSFGRPFVRLSVGEWEGEVGGNMWKYV